MMAPDIKWGLVIQGPIVGFGQGPNNSKSGFCSYEVIHDNIKRLGILVDRIVISTWKESGFKLTDIELAAKVVLIENHAPHERDHDNRVKQFFSTLSGIDYLSNNSSVTHVLKIRTDQLVSPNLISWLSDFYSSSAKRFNSFGSLQKNYLVFSEFREDTPYYLGDFIIAGEISDIRDFCNKNFNYRSTNLHPSVGVDYVLKYLSGELYFNKTFLKALPLLFQISNEKNNEARSYWNSLMFFRFTVVPKEIYETIVWRDKIMTDVLREEVIAQFGFHDNWSKIQLTDQKRVSRKTIFQLIPTKSALYTARYEYTRYFKALVKYYFKKFKIKFRS